jgi:hypothetical protein
MRGTETPDNAIPIGRLTISARWFMISVIANAASKR